MASCSRSRRNNGQRKAEQQRKLGLCHAFGCKNKPKEGYVTCESCLENRRKKSMKKKI